MVEAIRECVITIMVDTNERAERNIFKLENFDSIDDMITALREWAEESELI